MAGGNLNISEGDTGVEGGHDKGGSEPVGVDDPQSCPLADGPDPAMCGATILAMTVLSPC